jgi:hypothetical protein
MEKWQEKRNLECAGLPVCSFFLQVSFFQQLRKTTRVQNKKGDQNANGKNNLAKEVAYKRTLNCVLIQVVWSSVSACLLSASSLLQTTQ